MLRSGAAFPRVCFVFQVTTNMIKHAAKIAQSRCHKEIKTVYEGGLKNCTGSSRLRINIHIIQPVFFVMDSPPPQAMVDYLSVNKVTSPLRSSTGACLFCVP